MNYSMRTHVLKKLEEFKKNKITILTTQSMDEAERVGNKFVIMTKGKLILFDSLKLFKRSIHNHYTIAI